MKNVSGVRMIFAAAVAAVLMGFAWEAQATERFRLYNVGQTVAWRLNTETGDVSYCILVEQTLVCQDTKRIDALKKSGRKHMAADRGTDGSGEGNDAPGGSGPGPSDPGPSDPSDPGGEDGGGGGGHANAGRGNGSEGSPDADPGNSGSANRGGD